MDLPANVSDNSLTTIEPRSKLARLKPSFSELPLESRLELVLAIRANRRVSKRPAPAETTAKKRASSVSKRAPTKKDARALLAGITPEMAAALIEALGGAE